jgi:hypothetical protein
MKRTVSALILILLLISTITGSELFGLAKVNAQEPLSQIMSFEEAIHALEMRDFNLWHKSYTYTGQPNRTMLADETGISAYFMWFAPNGTFYEAEYPNGNTLNEIGHLLYEHNLNPPEGFFIWQLVNQSGMSGYWVLANNGTIVNAWPLRGSGPETGPPPIFELITVSLIFVAGIALLVYFKKRKH